MGNSPGIASRSIELLRRVLPLRFGITFLLVVATQLVYFLVIHVLSHRALRPSLENVLLLLYSFLTLTVLVQLVSAITSWSRPLRVAGNLLLVFCYVNFYGYHQNTRASLDYSVVADNIANAWSVVGVSYIVMACGSVAMIASAVVIAVLVVLEVKRKLVSAAVQAPPLWPKVLTSAALYGTILLAPVATYDDVTYFWQSAFDYYAPGSLHGVDHRPGTYPMVRNRGRSVAEAMKSMDRSGLPPVVLLTIESFNADVVEARDRSGRAYTPNFNRLLERGLYVERFYGNSVRTCKGLFAILFSTIPTIRGKAFVDAPELRARALPALLRDAGYETIFFQAYEDIDFCETGRFLKKNGFSVVESIYPYLTPAEKERIWGWGPEDAVFYRRFFQHLDRRRAHMPRDRPLFLHLATIVNHIDFSAVPMEKRAVYRHPESREESYINSIHLSDRHLGVFLEELRRRAYLKGALVVITGDHATPLGRFGAWNNETGFHDDSFRVPLLMLWDRRLAPRRISGRVHSQMDIAPTVLDLLGLEGVANHFQGVSMVGPAGGGQHPIYLVQPYSGRYLEVVRWPHKLVYHERTDGESVYDLARDPAQRNNLLAKADRGLVARLRADLRRIYLNQHLIQANALWPP